MNQPPSGTGDLGPFSSDRDDLEQGELIMASSTEYLKSKLVVKAVRNVRRGYEDDQSERGMYRGDVRLDLARSRLLTESYQRTDGLPMCLRRARALENIFEHLPITIQDWERIVGSPVSSGALFRH